MLGKLKLGDFMIWLVKYVKANLDSTIFVYNCHMQLAHVTYRLNQTYNIITTVARNMKVAVGF